MADSSGFRAASETKAGDAAIVQDLASPAHSCKLLCLTGYAIMFSQKEPFLLL